MGRIIGAVVVSFAGVSGAGLLLAWCYQPQVSARGMVAFVGTMGAVVAAVVAGNLWAAVAAMQADDRQAGMVRAAAAWWAAVADLEDEEAQSGG